MEDFKGKEAEKDKEFVFFSFFFIKKEKENRK